MHTKVWSRLKSIVTNLPQHLREPSNTARRNRSIPLWDSNFGQRVLDAEHGLMSDALRRVHGDAALWVGPDVRRCEALSQGMLRLPIYAPTPQATGNAEQPSAEAPKTEQEAQPEAERAVKTAEAAERAGLNHIKLSEPGHTLDHERCTAELRCELQELPFQSRSLDAVVLQHALEEADDPRVMLREVARVLAPGGRLVISAFNPWSALGLRRVYAAAIPDPLAGRRMISPIRLFDWLKLLGMELDAAPAYAGYGVSFNPAEGAPQLLPGRLPFCGLVTISAVKQAHSFRLRWQPPKNRQLAPVAYPRVASWRAQQTRLNKGD